MPTYLQKQIKSRMEAKGLTINALEKKAGLKRSAVRNILQDFSKKPSAETLKTIANVLGCSLDDIIGPMDGSVITGISKTPSLVKASYLWNEKLYINIIKTISKITKDRKLDLKFEQVIALASEVYKYSLGKKSDKIDQNFTNWLIEKNF